MSSESITLTSGHSPAHSGNASDHEALEQLDRELLVAERVRDYSDEIYMYTRQQWIDWKHQVDRERSAAAAGKGHHHSSHRNPTGHSHTSGGGSKRAHGPSNGGHGKHAIEGPAMTHGAGGYGAVKPRQEPFNFYAPTSPVSELVHSHSDGSD